MVRCQDISVVVQGAILHKENMTKRCCESIRRFLPGAEIILSTWEGEDVDGLLYDRCLMNQDPGAVKLLFKNIGEIKNNNINREIVSSHNGVESATRKYVMKIRSDTVLINDSIIDIINKMQCEFEERIMCFESLNPVYINKGIYEVCDFWFFGVKDLMSELWNIPLQTPCYASGGYDLVPEEYIFWQYCKRTNIFSINNKKDYLSVFCERFIIIQCNTSGIQSLKYPKYNNFWEVYVAHNKLSVADWKFYDGQRSIGTCLIHYLSVLTGFVWAVLRKLKNVVLGKK